MTLGLGGLRSFHVLGPVEARAAGRSVPLGGGRQLTLFAFLVLHANRAVSSDALIEAVWGPQREGAVKRLQMAITRLRRSLEPLETDRQSLLRTVSGGYVLSIAPGELDAETFADRVRQGRHALEMDEPVRAAELLREALDLWRGPPLSEVAFEDFARTEIRRLEELRLVALEARLDADLQLGRHANLVAELEALLADQPTRERFAGQLMLALYRSARQGDALEVYQRTRAHLAEELGLEPGPALKALQAQILEQARELEPPTDRDVQAQCDSPRTNLRHVDSPRRHELERADPLSPRFVGYARELDALEALLERTLRHSGGVALLAGEAGMGKSRLADELASIARRRGARVLFGRSWEGGGAPPYWPWIQSLRAYVRECPPDQLIAQLGSGAADIARMMPELRELLPAIPDVQTTEFERARFQLFDAVSSFVQRAAVERPVVFVLDDLHAADETSLMLLSFLAGSVADSRVLLIGTYRDAGLPTSHPLGATLVELTRNRRCLRLALRGLAHEDVAHLVELISGAAPAPRLVAAIHRMSEGNPLFVTELVRLLSAQRMLRELGPGDELPTPQGIGEVIARHAAMLSRDAQTTLAIASVIGREFDPNVVSEISDVASKSVRDQCDEAAGARLIEQSPDRAGCLRFAHALVRNTLYDQLPPAERARLHGAIGDALERRGSRMPDVPASELAHHFLEAAREGWAP